jgi:hypothetical protein
MKVRRWLLAGTALSVVMLCCSALFVTAASAATANPYGSSGSHGVSASSAPDTITGPKYDFCNGGGCPETVWTVDYSTGKFKDASKNKGTFTHSGKNYTFVFPNVGGSGVSCTFLGVKNTTGFSSAANPGTYTCTDGTNTTWYATKI